MRQSHFISRLAFGTILAAVTLAGCSKEPQPGPAPDPGLRFTVRFSMPSIEGRPEAASAPKGPESKAALAANTTVRIVAYRMTDSGVSTAAYAGEQTYVANAAGVLSPCKVDASGSYVADDAGAAMRLLKGNYLFCAMTPALPLGSNHATLNVPHGIDYAASTTDNDGAGFTIDESVLPTKSVTLATLQRQCAIIELVVTRDAASTNITALEVADGGVTLSYLTSSPLSATPGAPLVPTPVPSESSTLNVAKGAFVQSDVITASATIYVLPKVAANLGLSYNLQNTINSVTSTRTVAGKVSGMALDPGGRYKFTLTLSTPGATLTVTDWVDGGTQDNEMGE